MTLDHADELVAAPSSPGATRPARRDDLAATLGRHARAVTMAPLAHELARLIRPFHGSSPVNDRFCAVFAAQRGQKTNSAMTAPSHQGQTSRKSIPLMIHPGSKVNPGEGLMT